MKHHKSREIESAFITKGFHKKEGGSHIQFVFYYMGKPTLAHTLLSRGTADPGEPNLHKMKKQLFFNNPNDFDQFIECTFTEQDYIANLRNKGVIA